MFAARAMLSFEMADDRCDGGAPSHLPFDPAIGNSLLLELNSLVTPNNPVMLRREFACKSLNLHPDWAPKTRRRARIRRNSLLIPDNREFGAQTGWQLTAPSATQSSLYALCAVSERTCDIPEAWGGTARSLPSNQGNSQPTGPILGYGLCAPISNFRVVRPEVLVRRI